MQPPLEEPGENSSDSKTRASQRHIPSSRFSPQIQLFAHGESPLRATGGLCCFSPHGNAHQDQTSTGKTHLQSTCSSHIPKIRMPANTRLQPENPTAAKEPLPTERPEIPRTEPPNPCTKGESVMPDFHSQLGIPHPCQPLPPKAGSSLFLQHNQINSPSLLSFPSPKAPSWICQAGTATLVPFCCFCLLSLPKNGFGSSWMCALKCQAALPKHRFPKPPQQQVLGCLHLYFPH